MLCLSRFELYSLWVAPISSRPLKKSFYHVMHSCHGVSASTVWHIIRRVVPAILTLKRDFIRWPEHPLMVAAKFRDIAGFPYVARCVDETHVLGNPPNQDEDAYVNRHHNKSLNVAIVAGPDYTIYFCSSWCSGRWHDSRSQEKALFGQLLRNTGVGHSREPSF